jgi:hypothetical protein
MWPMYGNYIATLLGLAKDDESFPLTVNFVTCMPYVMLLVAVFHILV